MYSIMPTLISMVGATLAVALDEALYVDFSRKCHGIQIACPEELLHHFGNRVQEML